MFVDTMSQNLTCQLCSQLYTDPLMLPCLHSFCKNCLVELTKIQDTVVTCPSCNENSTIPQLGVTNFPHNFVLAQCVEEERMKNKLASSIQCEGCVTGSNAVVFCCECQEFLCASCRDHHKVWRKTKNHKLSNKRSVISEHNKMAAKPIYCSVPQHGDEKLNFYCNDCQVFICCKCLVVNHGGHFTSLSDKVVETSRRELKHSMEGCTGVVASLDKAIVSGETMIQRIQARRKDTDKDINDAFVALQKALANRHKAILQESDQVAFGKITAINIQLETFRKLKDQVSFASRLAATTLQSQQSTQLLSTKKVIQDRLGKLASEFKELSCELSEDDTILTSLDMTSLEREISEFGEVSGIDYAALYEVGLGVAIPLATVKKERKFTVVCQQHALEGPVKGKVPVVADLVSSNRREVVKVTTSQDKDGNYMLTCTPNTVGEYELSVKVRETHIKNSPYRMWVRQERDLRTLKQQQVYNVAGSGSNVHVGGVAVHSNGDVFASVTDGGGYIQVFNRDGTEKRRIGTQGSGDGQFKRPWGLTLVGDILYVVDYNHRVQRFTTNGEYLGQFGSCGSNNGQFRSPIGIVHDGSRGILVAEFSGRRVQVFTLDGTFINKFSCNGEMYDVAIDNDGHIHVPLWGSNKVRVFSSNGTKLYDYSNAKGNLNKPGGIAIDENGYRYIVTNGHLHILDPTGSQVNVIEGSGDAYGAVTLDKDGFIYVADYMNHRIVKF